jgi:beta-phosphoglucomutase-like phosphatase (HAD superfamily)
VEGHLEQLGLRKRFEVIICREDTSQHKPLPAPFLAAADAMDVSPSSCIVIEDSPNGIRSANAAGMFALAVPTEMTKDEDFATIGANRKIDSLAELPLPQLLNQLEST